MELIMYIIWALILTFISRSDCANVTLSTKATGANQTSTEGVTSPTTPDTTTSKYKSVCYKHVGCFSDSPPFDNAGLILPKSPEFIETTFQLYTRETQDSNETVYLDYTDVESLRNSSYDPARRTKFITHGFFNDIKSEWPYKIKDELLTQDDFNVITVAWGKGAAFPDYPGAVANTRVVAKQMQMLVEHMASLGAKYSDFHLIGHSLGAHTSGQVGQNLRKRNITIGRISGLDPAEPDYQDHPKSVRLDKNDAAFVDVIHTNGAPFGQGGAGLFEPCGHVDFYANGGKVQPDCPDQISGVLSHLGDLFTGHSDKVGSAVSCSHSRAHQLYLESINSQCPFTSYPCDGYKKFQDGECLSCGKDGCGTAGYNSDWYSARGMMFLNTRKSEPFCGHHYAVKVQILPASSDTTGSLMLQLNGTWGHSEWISVTDTEKDSLPRGKRVISVIVAEAIVGHLKSANVKYIKAKGNFFGWGAGNKEIKLEKINIEAGESGKKYLFCLSQTLTSGQAYTYDALEQDECPSEI